jgi:hypothetical protein
MIADPKRIASVHTRIAMAQLVDAWVEYSGK